MIRKAIIVIIFVFLLPQSGLFAITKPKHYNINRPKDRKDIEYPHNEWDMLADIGWGILYSLGGGYAAVQGNITGAIIGAGTGAKNILKAVEKYQENLQYERELVEKSYNNYEPMEKEYDQGYDAYERMTN